MGRDRIPNITTPFNLGALSSISVHREAVLAFDSVSCLLIPPLYTAIGPGQTVTQLPPPPRLPQTVRHPASCEQHWKLKRCCLKTKGLCSICTRRRCKEGFSYAVRGPGRVHGKTQRQTRTSARPSNGEFRRMTWQHKTGNRNILCTQTSSESASRNQVSSRSETAARSQQSSPIHQGSHSSQMQLFGPKLFLMTLITGPLCNR